MQLYSKVMAHLSDGGGLLIDGATGTEIERRGAAMDEGAWCAMATKTHPDILKSVHRDYIRAGARVITTNTFSTNRNMLEPAGHASDFELLNDQACALALAARTEEGAEDKVLVAGSMSHQVPFVNDSKGGVTSRTLPPLEVAERNFEEMANRLASNGVDFILLEMMSQPELANLAIEAVRGTGLPFWVGFTVGHDDELNVVSHNLRDLPASQMFANIDFEDADAAGIMHSSVNVTQPGLDILREHFEGPLMAYPDSGYFTMPHWHFENIIPCAELNEFAEQWMESGAQIIGTCCGLGIEHIEALNAHFSTRLGGLH